MMTKPALCLALLTYAFGLSAARAEVLFVSGPTDPAMENVLFNQPGLIRTGNTVQGQAESTGFLVNLTFFRGRSALTTTSAGEPRVDAPGWRFNSLRFWFDDPRVSFAELDFAVNADQVGAIAFNAVTIDGRVFSSTSSLDAPFVNDFSVQATAGERLQEVSYSSPAPFTVDVRRIRVGGVAALSVGIPEPGVAGLVACGLVGLVGASSHRRRLG